MKDKEKTKEQLIKELVKLHQRIAELEKKETESKEGEEKERQYIRDLMSLSRTAIGLVDLSPEEDIYQFIAEKLKELVGDCVISMNSFDEVSNNFCVRAVVGIGKHMDKVLKMLGKHPVGMITPINDEARNGLTSGKLEKVPGGLYELSVGAIPKATCNAIEKLLNLSDIYAMGFSWKGRLFGSAAIFMRKGAELEDPSIIETFVRQASIALQRRQAEEALRKAKEELEIRVKKRTKELAKSNEELQLEITERRRAEEALMKSEASLAEAQRIAHLGNWDWDIKNNEVRWSDEIYRIFGLAPKKFSATYEAFLNSVHPDDRDYVRKSVDEALNERKPYCIDHRIVLPNGSERVVHEQAEVAFDEAGKPIRMVGTVQDITERKKADQALRESEEKLKTIMENVNDVIFQLSPLGIIRYVSPKVKELYGYKPEELIGKHLKKTTPMSEIPKALETLKSVLSGKVIKNYEINQLDSKGKIVHMEINATPVKKRGKIIAVQGIMRDITERKKTTDELEKAYADLKKTQQELIQSEKLAALGRFSSGITHEIKNPLGIILGGLEFLERKLSRADADVKTAVDKIKESTFRANTILEGLLKFARPSKLKTERIKPNDLINETLSLLKYRTPLSSMKIETHFVKEELYIEADKNQMQQVFFNLLMNAVEAMPTGGMITVKTYKMAPSEFSPDAGFFVSEVKDTGEGIAKENLEKIFEPFFTTKKERKGIGLGLSMTKMIVDNHKGHLEITSKLGKGTTAKIILPLASKEV